MPMAFRRSALVRAAVFWSRASNSAKAIPIGSTSGAERLFWLSCVSSSGSPGIGISHEGARDRRSDADDGRDEILGPEPRRRTLDRVVDLPGDHYELFLHRFEPALDAFLQSRRRALLALTLARVAAANAAVTPSNDLAHRRDPSSPVRPMTRAMGLGEGLHLRRIDHHDRQPRSPSAGRHHALAATRRLHRDDCRCPKASIGRPEPRDQRVDPRRIPAHRKRLGSRQNVHVQAGLRHVDPDDNHLHLIPSPA